LAIRVPMLDRIPIVSTLRGYKTSSVRPDLIAGIVLATMLLPQGMAYAEVTGLPPVTGIYTTIAALVAYAIFGPNRRLVVGPDSSLAPVIAAVVLPLAVDDQNAVALASAMSLLAGLICVVSGYLNLGVLTELLSKPIRIGFLNGVAVLIFLSQIPEALGFDVEADTTFELLTGTVNAVLDSQVVGPAMALSLACIVVIVLVNRRSRWRPGVVVAAVGSIIAVSLFDLAVEVVGAIPTGLPPLTFPQVGLDVLPSLAWGAVAVALVSFADSGALSAAMAQKSGEDVDPNGEIKALGAVDLLAGLFQGFAASASSSRTAVALAVGSRTQVAGLVAALGVILVVVLAPGLVSEMPQPTLAAIVITASFALFDWRGWAWLLRVRRSEFLLSLATTLAVLLLGVLEGIGVAILLALANFVRIQWRPHSTELGEVAGIPGYHDLERHPEARLVEGLLIVRYDAPLFFANAPDFARRLAEMLTNAGRPIERVLVVGNPITDIDSTGAEVLTGVIDDLDRRDVAFAFAGLKGPVKDRLRSYGLYDRIGDENFYPNTISGVEAHLRGSGGPTSP
jgi:high affinity sulfate transporter 1